MSHIFYQHKKNYHIISGIWTKFTRKILLFSRFKYICMIVIHETKSLKVKLPRKPTWGCFIFIFHLQKPKPKQTAEWPAVERRSQKWVKYSGIIIFIKRNTDMIKGDLKIYIFKKSKSDFYSSHYFKFFKKLCVFTSTLCMTGKLWMSWFRWQGAIFYCINQMNGGRTRAVHETIVNCNITVQFV